LVVFSTDMLRIVEVPGISKAGHPDLFGGLEAMAGEFPNGWFVIVTPGNNVFLEVKLTAPSGQSRKRLLKDQTALGVQTLLRRLHLEAKAIQHALRSALAGSGDHPGSET
jgi:hypothetical protein